MRTKVHLMTLVVIDHDDLGAEEVRQLLENTRYPNDCMYPDAIHSVTRVVDWSDDHPLNNPITWESALRDLFGEELP